jgi:hypothetical protein
LSPPRLEPSRHAPETRSRLLRPSGQSVRAEDPDD